MRSGRWPHQPGCVVDGKSVRKGTNKEQCSVPVPSLAAMHAAPWEPCLVVPLPKPPRHWTADDHAAVAQAKADQQEFTPEDAWSLGPWSKVVLDPTIWGHGDTPLFSYAVKVGRQRCLEAAVAQRYKKQYVVGRGMRPRIWEVEPLHAVQPAAGPSNREAAFFFWRRTSYKEWKL